MLMFYLVFNNVCKVYADWTNQLMMSQWAAKVTTGWDSRQLQVTATPTRFKLQHNTVPQGAQRKMFPWDSLTCFFFLNPVVENVLRRLTNVLLTL